MCTMIFEEWFNLIQVTEQVTMSTVEKKKLVSGFCFCKNVLSGRQEGVIVFNKTGITVIFSLFMKTFTSKRKSYLES